MMKTYLLGTIVIPVIAVILFIIQTIMNKSLEYRCDNCGEIFSLAPIIGVVAPYSMGKKFVKCPKCEMTAWASPVLKDN